MVPHFYTFESGGFTVEAWVRSTGGTGGDPASVVSTLWEDPMEATTWGFQLNVGNWSSGDEVLFEVYAGWSGGSVTGPAIRGDGQWHHIAAVYDGDLDLYVDGVHYVGSYGDYDYMESDLRIGASTQTWYSHFEGDVDEVRLWDHARTMQEIREHAHLTLSGAEPGLYSYWQRNEAPGSTTLLDATGLQDGAVAGAGFQSSPVPAGSGTSASMVLNETGYLSFAGTGLELDVTQVDAAGTLTATRLDRAPNLLPGEFMEYDSQYWILRAYDGAQFHSEYLLSPFEPITSRDEIQPELLKLYTRPHNAVETWQLDTCATWASASLNQARFVSPGEPGQLLMARDGYPRLLATTPAAMAENVAPQLHLQLVFNQPMQAGSGQLHLLDTQSGSIVFSVDAAAMDYDDTQVSIDPGVNLELQTSYHVLVNPGALLSLEGVSFAGIEYDTAWSFTTLPWFTDLQAGLPGASRGELEWGDFDNDGDLDLAICGDSDGPWVNNLYRNDNGVFVDHQGQLLQEIPLSLVWGDRDNDGDLDLATTGFINPACRIFGNETGTLALQDISLPEALCDVEWGDYDSDGDQDLFVCGRVSWNNGNRISKILRNDGNMFTDIAAGLVGIHDGDAAWVDFDNDGDLDLALAGRPISAPHAVGYMYLNENGVFSAATVGMPAGCFASMDWADYDGDGDLDLALLGSISYHVGFSSLIFRNNCTLANQPPVPPTALSAEVVEGRVRLDWDEGQDAESPTASLSYNLRAGFANGGVSFVSPLSDPEAGSRLVSRIGNTQLSRSKTLSLPSRPHEVMDLWWGVQVIDGAFAGSPFVETMSPVVLTYLRLENEDWLDLSGELRWAAGAVNELESYQLQIAPTTAFAAPVVDENLVLDVTQARDGLYYVVTLATLGGSTQLEDNTRYYWRIRPVYSGAGTTVFSATPGEFLFVPPLSPPQSVAIAVNQDLASLSWEAVPGELVYYVIYSSPEADAPFPDGWALAGPPTTETAWLDPEAAVGKRFYRVIAVVVD